MRSRATREEEKSLLRVIVPGPPFVAVVRGLVVRRLVVVFLTGTRKEKKGK